MKKQMCSFIISCSSCFQPGCLWTWRGKWDVVICSLICWHLAVIAVAIETISPFSPLPSSSQCDKQLIVCATTTNGGQCHLWRELMPESREALRKHTPLVVGPRGLCHYRLCHHHATVSPARVEVADSCACGLFLFCFFFFFQNSECVCVSLAAARLCLCVCCGSSLSWLYFQ